MASNGRSPFDQTVHHANDPHRFEDLQDYLSLDGKNLLHEGNLDEAIECFRFLLKLNPSDRLGAVDKLAEGGLILTAEIALWIS